MPAAISRVHGITVLVMVAACTPRTRRTPDDTIVVLSPEPMATFRADLDFGIVSFHPGAGAKLGAGPYLVRELGDTRVMLDANPYYATPAKTPHVEIRVVRNDAARMLMLVGGSVDLLQNA